MVFLKAVNKYSRKKVDGLKDKDLQKCVLKFRRNDEVRIWISTYNEHDSLFSWQTLQRVVMLFAYYNCYV